MVDAFKFAIFELIAFVVPWGQGLASFSSNISLVFLPLLYLVCTILLTLKFVNDKKLNPLYMLPGFLIGAVICGFTVIQYANYFNYDLYEAYRLSFALWVFTASHQVW